MRILINFDGNELAEEMKHSTPNGSMKCNSKPRNKKGKDQMYKSLVKEYLKMKKTNEESGVKSKDRRRK